jgi:hypothetical protein
MPNVKNMQVDVIVTKDTNPKGVSFALDAGKGKKQTIDFDNDKHPGVMVYFNIVEDDPQNPTGLVFKPTPSNCLWVDSQSTTCPPGPCVWNQFVPLSVEDPGKTGKNTQLIVYCRNKTVKQFAFTLWFLWPTGREVDYDPIGNGNNGQRE